jgi:predicted cupin superfamily sugar epimerase
MSLTAEEIQSLLGLERHPTCGYVALTYRSAITTPEESLPPEYDGSRPVGSALYFLVTPDAPIVLHRIRSDQQYHHYLGDALELLMLTPDGAGRLAMVGGDLRAGMRPQVFIPGGAFHVARLRKGGEFALLGSTEWPGVDPSDVERGDYVRLSAQFPDWRSELEAFKNGESID